MDFGIKGKVAVITGGGSGMGKATAKLLAQEGVKLALVGRTPDKIEAAAQEVAQISETIPVTADLTKSEDVEAAKQKILDHYGTVDILVNSAGITGATGEFLELTEEDWYETIEINFLGAVRVCRAFIPSMQQSGWGRIILLGSEDAVHPYTEDMPYCATKAAILNFAKNLSKEYGKDGILVNSVSPAYVESPMTNAMMVKRSKEKDISFEKAVETFLAEERPNIELHRRGRVEEVAAVIAFLCSQQSSFVTGSNYRVDGGSVPTVGT
ncbi:MAG: SDR family oxidoreductase [Cyanobacteria bacterium J06635_13]